MTDFSIAVISPACRVLPMFWRPTDTVWLVAEFVWQVGSIVWRVAEFIWLPGTIVRWVGVV
ncbi:hypothetical protein [Sunxiuqinia rutila]|uniref:hypothetical protein n=1 Tax=Sunxiuqinia rutila TaxID=1397841 RepID=UPI003D366AAA